jgi:hypothetical protein
MANVNINISLMAYLQKTIPAVATSLHGPVSTANTQDAGYNAGQIHNVGVWNAFNLNTITNAYGNPLNNARISNDAMAHTPPQPVSAEQQVRTFVVLHTYQYVKRALRCGFNHQRQNNQMGGHTALSYHDGPSTRVYGNYMPDIAYFDPQANGHSRPNRAPGDVKPSWKWSMGLRNSPDPMERTEFKQALSQVNHYMKLHHARYGFIITDLELVAIRRLDNNGNLELSAPIPMRTQGNANHPSLTPLLALWYLGMLASGDAGPNRWNM